MTHTLFSPLPHYAESRVVVLNFTIESIGHQDPKEPTGGEVVHHLKSLEMHTMADSTLASPC